MFQIREARPEDSGLILTFIQAIAAYEKMEDQVRATEEDILETVFRQKYARVMIGEEDGNPVGFALFYHNYSTFLGKPGIHLEDIFVFPQHRKKGYGRKLLKCVANVAMQKGCGRMEWSCLNWNKSAMGFYESLGAEPLKEWTVYRLSGEGMALKTDNKIEEE